MKATTRILDIPWVAAAVAALVLASTPAQAAPTVWNFNYARFSGLQADESGNLTLSFGITSPFANHFPINGFQLVKLMLTRIAR